MVLTIPLYYALTAASTVSSALLIHPSARVQSPGTESGSVPVQLHNVTAHGRINNSVLSLPTGVLPNLRPNTSLSTLHLSAEPIFDCDEGWGRTLNLQMCGEALASVPWMISLDTRPATFGPRDAGTFDVGLPRRWMSSDGICGIQPFLVPGRESARVAPVNVYVTTAALIQTCVGGHPSKGGQARDFGGDDNLLISVTEYDPYLWSDNVRCFGSIGGAGIVESCNGLAGRMDASEVFKTFGPGGQPHDYVTPYTLTAEDNRCYLKISSHPNNRYPRTSSWYEIWEAAIIVNAMCIRHGKKGAFKVHSFDKDVRWLEVEVGDLQTGNDLTT